MYIKGQELAEFFGEWKKDELVIHPQNPSKEIVSVEMVTTNLWKIYVDGACNLIDTNWIQCVQKYMYYKQVI